MGECDAYVSDPAGLTRLQQGYRDCIEDLKEWGALALSSDYAGPGCKEQLARDITRHEANLTEHHA